MSEKLYPMVFRMLGTTSEAEDAIQEIMLNLWVKRGKLQQSSNLMAYVFRSARNHCLDKLRTVKANKIKSTLTLETLGPEFSAEQTEWTELNSIIRELLKDLPPQQSEILILRDLDGYEYSEIAAAMELKVEYVRVLLSRARKKISSKLEKVYNYERE